VSAGRPVQPVCIMYEDAQGRQSIAPAYIDDLSLKDSLDAMLNAGPITAHVYVGEALEPGDDRRKLAARAQESVQAGLEAMRGRAVSGASTDVRLAATQPESVSARLRS
jgi:1-acyl-sn-glycerol-3-phosphate acyltransferase